MTDSHSSIARNTFTESIRQPIYANPPEYLKKENAHRFVLVLKGKSGHFRITKTYTPPKPGSEEEKAAAEGNAARRARYPGSCRFAPIR